MLRKDFDFMCKLFEVNKSDIKQFKEGYFYQDKYIGKDSIELLDNYYFMILDKIDFDEFCKVIRNIKYIDCGSYGSRATTKEGYTFINSITKEQFENIKNIDRKLLKLTKEEQENISDENKQALKIIYGFLLRQMIKKSEIYFEKEFDKLFG
ncbi:hypothetical protein [Clostridium perfringens]|uniref:hypothetical protein n=1 Tax=Clostridium perfringens TaxID=1502 RepID=UPI0024BC045B|nr:hypothetical protein [Clostridium perfringens]